MRAAVGRLVVALAAAVLIAGLVLAAFGFVIAGAYLWLADRYDPVSAAICIGVALLLFTVMAGLLFWLMVSRQRGVATAGRLNRLAGIGPPSSDPLGVAQTVGDWVGQDSREFLRRNAVTATLVALVCGFALGVSPRLRRSLWWLLR
jgi:hypothetical protein